MQKIVLINLARYNSKSIIAVKMKIEYFKSICKPYSIYALTNNKNASFVINNDYTGMSYSKIIDTSMDMSYILNILNTHTCGVELYNLLETNNRYGDIIEDPEVIKQLLSDNHYIDDYFIGGLSRDDVLYVRAVEAIGNNNEIGIVKIPDNIKWVITTHGGIDSYYETEYIEEIHQEWHLF